MLYGSHAFFNPKRASFFRHLSNSRLTLSWILRLDFCLRFAAVKNDRGEPTYRAEEIGRRMAEYDIVGLQEAFDTPARERILGELQKARSETVAQNP